MKMAAPDENGQIKVLVESLLLNRVASILNSSVRVPIPIRLQAVKMNNLRPPGPARIMLKIVRQEVLAIVRDHSDGVCVSHCKCIHDDLVSRGVETIGDSALEILQVVIYFSLTKVKSCSLN